MCWVITEYVAVSIKGPLIWGVGKLEGMVIIFWGISVFHFHFKTTSTLNRKTLTSFVRTKPRGSVVITKPLALRMSLCAHKVSWLYYMDLYHLIMLYESLCFTKGTVNSYYSLCKNKLNTTCHVCSGIYFVVINYNPL